MANEVTVVDYNAGNLHSVRRALEHIGAKPVLTSQPAEILSADRLILPGVGAFSSAMGELEVAGLTAAVKAHVATGKPFLGICLGMQMMLDESAEFGRHRGLGLIPGRVVPMPSADPDGKTRKIPFVGWSGLAVPAGGSWSETILADLEPGDACYFVHSFAAQPDNMGACLAFTEYEGLRVPAVIGAGRAFGCQFHPEKSGPVGLMILSRFLVV